VAGYPPVVLKALVNGVFVALNKVVSDAVRATNVTLPDPSTVYRPIRIRVAPAAAVVEVTIVRLEMVLSSAGVKNDR
jgi:hypothetical protein